MCIRAPYQKGYLIVLTLVYGAIFFAIITAFMGFIMTENRLQHAKTSRERALEIAEAGLDYYRWYLAHYPNDLQNGTGAEGPYVHAYEDPELGRIGEFSLEVEGSMMCGDISSVDIYATGSVDGAPEYARTVYAKYARPTVAEFAYIINSNVWAGADRTVVGPYHSNGGVRMDGTNNSTVSSGLESVLCTSALGCSPDETQDGVFGDGPNGEYWSFPSPPINFTGLSVDLVAMKSKAQSSGRYFAPSGDDGYHIVLRSNDTFDLYRVTDTTQVVGYTTEAGSQNERHIIASETLLGNYTIPDGCPVIFTEDKLWLEGVVTKRITVAAANVTTIGVDPYLILENDITYAEAVGTSTPGLLAIGEHSVLIPLDSPNNMTLSGIFVAQLGRFGRNHYDPDDLPGTLDPYVIQNSLTVHGTIVSNGREGTKWTSGGVQMSGYTTRYNSYDRDLVSNPPPLTPHTSDTYSFIEWREVD